MLRSGTLPAKMFTRAPAAATGCLPTCYRTLNIRNRFFEKAGARRARAAVAEFCLHHSGVMCDEDGHAQREEWDKPLEAVANAISKRGSVVQSCVAVGGGPFWRWR